MPDAQVCWDRVIPTGIHNVHPSFLCCLVVLQLHTFHELHHTNIQNVLRYILNDHNQEGTKKQRQEKITTSFTLKIKEYNNTHVQILNSCSHSLIIMHSYLFIHSHSFRITFSGLSSINITLKVTRKCLKLLNFLSSSCLILRFMHNIIQSSSHISLPIHYNHKFH